MHIQASRFILILCLTVAVVACQPAGENRPHTTLAPDMQALRTAFNAESGKVRVVMLVAPT